MFALFLAFGLVLSLLQAMPAIAHPEGCVATDDQQVDEDCAAEEAGTGKELEEEAAADGHNEAPTEFSGTSIAGFDTTKNLRALGFSERTVPFTGSGSGVLNSDLAFWGDYAIQGHYAGFRIIDISEPGDPVELVNFEDCVSPTSTLGSQGDVVVYGDVLVRSWDAPRAGPQLCGGVVTPAGQEGVHIFDISDPAAPQALTFVQTPCGSHTASGVPDLDNDRLLVYSSPSSSAAGCRGIDIIEVPLSDPGAASYLRFLPSGQPTPAFPNVVTIHPPSPAAGVYQASGAQFGPAPAPAPEGLQGSVAVVNTGGANPAQGCAALIDFPAGAIAVADRGTCPFVDKARNAEAAGAVALIVANNVDGAPTTMGGDAPDVTIPSVMVGLADGNTIKAGLPATATVQANATPADPERACHDTGVILGDVMKAACAGGDGVSVWSMDPADGGSLADPALLYSRSFEGVSIGHSAAFTWDGEVLVFGHEPGGGGQARCQESSTEVDRTLFFLDARTGETIGTLLHPRPQGPTENCTWHNYNVVPTDRRYVLVSGNYQAGISVVDFTNPAAPREIAFADPEPLVHPTNPNQIVTGGDWSTYWYNGFIYQSDIRRGLLIWKLSDPAVAGATKLPHLNPQTQETSFPLRVRPLGGGGPRP